LRPEGHEEPIMLMTPPNVEQPQIWDYCTLYAIFIRDKPIFLSERMLQKSYDCKGSV
jgi:hypothetical protein